MKNIIQTVAFNNNKLKSLASTEKFWINKNLSHVYEWICTQATWATSTAEKIYCVMNNITTQPSCSRCGQPVAYKQSKGYLTFCSRGCAQQDAVLKQQRHAKQKQTLMDRYGVDNPSLLEEVRQKISNASKGKTRGVNVSHHARNHLSDQVKSLLTDPNKLVDWFHSSGLPITVAAKTLGLSDSTLCNALKRNHIDYSLPSKTYVEQVMVDFCRTLNVDVHTNNRAIISPLELDIVLPEKKLAIEVNGLFWHSVERKGVGYHKHKLTAAAQAGYGLLQFWDTEVTDKLEIVQSIIKTRLNLSNRLHARSLLLGDVTVEKARDFLNENHIQGDTTRHSVRYGLYTANSELVALMTFGRHPKYQWELVRFCAKRNLSVVGGASRLFKAFVERTHAQRCVSYCDQRLFTGNLYINLGFELTHTSRPNYFYVHPSKYCLESRLKYQKHKLKDVLSVFDPQQTEQTNMKMNGFYRVEDCGHKVFVWNSRES